MFSKSYFIFYIFSILNYSIVGNCDLQVLKFIPQNGVDDGLPSTAQYIGISDPNTGTQFAKADRICVFGIWGLYSTPNYGLGFEASTTVITVVGKNQNKLECSSSGQIRGLTQVKSVRYFGNRDANADGISILSDPYLLGGAWDPQTGNAAIDMDTTDISGVRMGSVAITGNSSWQLCSDKDCKFEICVDVAKSRYGIVYLNRDTLRDTASKWPLVINNVGVIARDRCAQITNPNYQRMLWRADVEEKSGLDFHEYAPRTNDSALSDDDDIDTITTTVIP